METEKLEYFYFTSYDGFLYFKSEIVLNLLNTLFPNNWHTMSPSGLRRYHLSREDVDVVREHLEVLGMELVIPNEHAR